MTEMTPEERIAELERKLEKAKLFNRDAKVLINNLRLGKQDAEQERDEALAKLAEAIKWITKADETIDLALTVINDGVQEAIGENSAAFREMP